VRETAVAIDSNLLLLLVVGIASRDYIEKHKRLKAYSLADFDLLVRQLSDASKVVLTPNTLTETSNLIEHIGEPARSHIYRTLKHLMDVDDSNEQYIPSKKALARPEATDLGQLYLAAIRSGAVAVNFNHLRDPSDGAR
jgi:hypothetical protein